MLAGCSLVIFGQAIGQQRLISMKEAITLATQQQQLQAMQGQALASSYEAALAKNSLMPDLSAGYQAGYATYNNITGMNYPGLMMPITGPPSSGNRYDPVAGTAAALLLKWSPVTFGQRKAAVDKAMAQFHLSNSQYNSEAFRQQYLAAYTYLDAVYLQSLLHSMDANIVRTEAGLAQSLVLAHEGLRAGIDTIQFQSVLAQARMDRINTLRQYQSQLLELARLAGLQQLPEDIALTDTLLITKVPAYTDTVSSYAQNPVYNYYTARKAVSMAALHEVNTAWRPRLDIWANAYSRGSGVAADGAAHAADGWSLTRNNFGAGVQVSFPLLQFSQVNIRKKQFKALLKADEQQLSQVSFNLRQQLQTAQYNYRQNAQAAQLAPVQTKAASLAYEGLKVSYAAGLTDYSRLIQGQYDLLKAETAAAAANLQVWRSLLEIATVAGDMHLFTDQLK